MFPSAPLIVIPFGPAGREESARVIVVESAPDAVIPSAPLAVIPSAPDAVMPSAPEAVIPLGRKARTLSAPLAVIPEVFQKLMPSAPDAVIPFEPMIVSPPKAGTELSSKHQSQRQRPSRFF